MLFTITLTLKWPLLKYADADFSTYNLVYVFFYTFYHCFSLFFNGLSVHCTLSALLRPTMCVRDELVVSIESTGHFSKVMKMYYLGIHI